MMEDKEKMPPTFKLVVWGIGLFVVLILLLMLNPFVTIGASERGVMLNWGAASDQLLDPGLHFRMPIKQSVRTVSIQPLQLDHKIMVNSDGAITKDNQTIGADLTIFYKYKPDQIVKMYKEYGEDKIKAIITQSLRESFKAEIGNYDIFKLPTVQEEIRGKVWGKLEEKMANYPVELTELKVVNYDWSDQFDAQIASTMQKAQEVKQKEQELLIAQNEQQKKVKEAEAEKTALITKAEGQKTATITQAEGEKESAKLKADAKALEGEGIRKYNESVAQKWDIEKSKLELEIAKLKVDKWNGVYVSTNNYGPIPLETGALQGK